MAKRDKRGRFIKAKTVKKKAKVAKKHAKKANKQVKKVIVQHANRSKLSDLTLYDLQDMIQAEVLFQMKELW